MAAFDDQVGALLEKHPISEILRSIAGRAAEALAGERGLKPGGMEVWLQVSRLHEVARVLLQAARKIDM